MLDFYLFLSFQHEIFIWDQLSKKISVPLSDVLIHPTINTRKFFIIQKNILIEPWENLLMPYANNKGADQPTHPRSLISTFVGCYWVSIILYLYLINPKFQASSYLCSWAGQFECFKPLSILILTVPRWYFCWSSLLLLVLAVRIYTLVHLLCEWHIF